MKKMRNIREIEQKYWGNILSMEIKRTIKKTEDQSYGLDVNL